MTSDTTNHDSPFNLRERYLEGLDRALIRDRCKKWKNTNDAKKEEVLE